MAAIILMKLGRRTDISLVPYRRMVSSRCLEGTGWLRTDHSAPEAKAGISLHAYGAVCEIGMSWALMQSVMFGLSWAYDALHEVCPMLLLQFRALDRRCADAMTTT